jgi:multidrug efflux system membrane fusion protein
MDDRPSELREAVDRPLRPPLRRPAPSRWPRRVGLLVIVLVLAALGWIVFKPQPQPVRTARFALTDAPMPVVAATAESRDMPVTLSELGTVTPLATVTVRTQINGQLVQLGFSEGQEVNKGDFLAQIDARPYQAALDNAQGALARDQAQLENAKRDLVRFNTLVTEKSIAQQQRDTQEALVKQLVGTIAADQAQIDMAKLNVAYCHIVAPVSGRVGLRQVDLGNYVQVSDASGLVVITQLKPISVIFTLPEDNLAAVMKRMGAGATLAVTAFDRSGKTKLADGTLSTIDNQIDTSTGTVKLRAQFDNKDEELFPNQFVNVQLLVETLKGATVVPSAAVLRGAPGTYVYLIKPDNTVTVQKIVLGPSDRERVAVTDGLKPGDRVVVDGADKLREGAKVTLPGTNATTNRGGAVPASDAAPAAAPSQPAGNPATPPHQRRPNQ